MAVDVGTIRSEVRVKLSKLKGDIAKLDIEFDKITKSSKEAATKTEKSFTQGFKKINLAGVAAFAGIAIAVKAAITTFAEFEQSIANVGSIAGATEEEFQALEDAARSAGEITRFSASQAADALFFLASAGFDAKESIAALDGVLLLAGATGSDLASTASTVTATLSQFSLAASESARVANVFAAANANSQATVEKLNTSLRQVGPIAGQLGISLEETVASLESLFNAGLRGEQAGTALRSILLDLADSSSPVVEQLNQLGIAFEEIDPRSVGLTGSIERLAESGADLGSIFGKVAAAGILTLSKTASETEGNLRDLEAEITSTNEAAKQYEIQNDTLAGSIDIFKSTLSETAISFTKEFAPALRTAIEVATGFLRIINQLPGELKIFIGIIAAAIPIIGAGATALTFFGVAVTAALGPIAAVVVGVAAITAGVAGLSKNIKENRIKQLEDDFGSLSKSLELIPEQVEAVEGALTRGGNISGNFQNAREQVEALAENLNISREKIIQIGLESKNVSAQYREQLQLVKDTIEEQKKSSAIEREQAFLQEQRRLRAIKNIGATTAQIRLQEEAARKNAKQLTEEIEAENKISEAAKKRQELIKANIKSRIDAEKAFKEEVRIVNDLQKVGLIDSLEANKRLIKANEQLVESLVDVGYNGLRGDIGDGIINKSIESIKQLKSANEELKKSIEDAEKAEKEKTDSDIIAFNKLIDFRAKQTSIITNLEEKAVFDFETSLLRRQQTLRDLGKTEVEIAQDIANRKAEFEIERQRQSDEERLELLDEYTSEVLGLANSFFSALSNYYKVDADSRIQSIDEQTTAQLLALDQQTQATLEALGLQEQTTLQKLQTELEALTTALNAETNEEKRAAIEQEIITKENEIKKTEILNNAEKERTKIVNQAEREKARIAYEADLKQWEISLLLSVANAAAAAIKTLAITGFTPAGFAAVGVGAIAAGLEIAAINKSKPKPPSFQTGGIVLPSPGGSLVNVAENGNPELLLNSGGSGRALLTEFADLIAQRVSGGKGTTIIQNNTVNTDTLENLQKAARLLTPYDLAEVKRRG